MLLAECSESIGHSHTAHTKKCPDSIVGKRQRPQAFLIYSYVSSTAIGTWHSVLQSQHGHCLVTLLLTINKDIKMAPIAAHLNARVILVVMV